MSAIVSCAAGIVGRKLEKWQKQDGDVGVMSRSALQRWGEKGHPLRTAEREAGEGRRGWLQLEKGKEV